MMECQHPLSWVTIRQMMIREILNIMGVRLNYAFFIPFLPTPLLQTKSITTFVSRNTFIWPVPPTLSQVLCLCRTLQAGVLTPRKEGFPMVQTHRRSVGIPVLSRTLPPAVHLSSQRAYRQAIGGRWQKETILEGSSKDCSLSDCYALQYSFSCLLSVCKDTLFPRHNKKKKSPPT